MVVSLDPDARSCKVGWNETDLTHSVCPDKFATS